VIKVRAILCFRKNESNLGRFLYAITAVDYRPSNFENYRFFKLKKYICPVRGKSTRNYIRDVLDAVSDSELSFTIKSS